ncbi:Protein of unknown function [Actinokineospora alba]|uniref:DUF3515 domain-containing protein n=1 Tax=Actinokineospora alba TaxID=504798 RepID=A0A1H0I1Q1_9PSEU|nr:DUF3515 domain-containing protein [Actinokineospora alba]TDP64656.1 uncharacterized protein DUF3515 [Actinokineospora alba]SDI84822.1 Protein of unknown function [Actinokineospora alba]SDO25060.1 Protein of unknown function [Actinokineospora alba]
MSDQPLTGPPRAAVIAAVVLVGLLAVGVVIASRFLPSEPTAPTTSAVPKTGPVGLVPVDAPDSGSTHCTAVLKALPTSLVSAGTTLSKLPLADPAPQGAVAWGDRIAPPVVLRCGLPKPAELTPTSALREVSGVKWLPIEGTGSSTWFVVDRPVHVALTLPQGVGTGPLQTVSEVVGATLPAQPVKP